MKKLNFYLVISLVGLAVFLSSCEKEDTSKDIIITFENVKLNAEGFQNNFPDGLILEDVNFYNDFEDFGVFAYWEGFAVSNNTDRETAGYDNQYSVYASSGAGGSKNFALVYSGFNEVSYCKFLENQEFNIKSLMINNSTYAALEIKNGGFGKKFEAGDWFKIIITGFDARGNETGKVEFYLADFRNGKSYICQEWTKVDLTNLGKVNKLEFTFASTDNDPVLGINTPEYACIDNIIYLAN